MNTFITFSPAGVTQTAMHLEKLQAFVISSSDYGESDRIVSLFTLEHGRLKGFARGARNSRKRFGPALETFARIDLQLNRKDGLSSLRSADVITLYSGIRCVLGAIAHGLYACELVECLTPEGQPLPRLYRLLAAYLERLDSGHSDDADRRLFEINLLNILGYRPSLQRCGRCGSTFDAHGALMQQGGELVCRFCAVTGRQITSAALQGLSSCLATGRFGLVAFDQESLQLAGVLIDESLANHSSRKFKSLEFLQQAGGSDRS
ncbi:MAG: DNA repair protein RecO [Desulfuromonadaceae bacterium]|nr:DNA repair protein RecO [Desulfuromonadaceae bacterium]